MKRAPEILEKTFKELSKQEARLIRQIWKEGQERATRSVIEARKLDKIKAK